MPSEFARPELAVRLLVTAAVAGVCIAPAVSRRAAANNAKVVGDSSGLVGSVPANGLTKFARTDIAAIDGLTASGGPEIPVITGAPDTTATGTSDVVDKNALCADRMAGVRDGSLAL